MLSKNLLTQPLSSACFIAAVNLVSFILIAPYAPSATAGAAFLLPAQLFVGELPRINPVLQGYLVGATWKIFLISSMWGVGTIIGSFISALTSKKFRLRKPHGKVAARSFLGGLLMGLGVALTHGCNLLHILGGAPLLVPASILVSVAIIVGAYITLRVMLRYESKM